MAVNVEFPTNIATKSSLEISRPEGFQDWINGNCGFLVNVFDHKLFFIHQTAREFLLSSSSESRPEWLHSFTIEACHRLAAERCIAYLSYPFLVDGGLRVFPIENLESESGDVDLKEYPFFEYSDLYWSSHVTQALGKTEPNIDGQRVLVP